MNIPSPEQVQMRFGDIYIDSLNRAQLRVPFDNLDGGTRVLRNEAECISYIALYGGHHFYKLYKAYTSTGFENTEGKNVEIIDWGCGQALATCVLIDYLIDRNISLDVSSITLVEPSIVALERGFSLVQLMFQNDASIYSAVRQVNKYLDDLNPADFVSQTNSIKFHLFSNILDVEGFDLQQLYQLMVNSFQGLNRIVCTSPRGQQRLEMFYSHFLQSHQVVEASSSSQAISGEVFWAASGKRERRPISRCERQFTVDLTQC